jgi:hypothetical protein
MNREERSSFVEGYSKMLTQSWADEAYRKSVIGDAAGKLREAGVAVVAGTKVNVITEITSEGTLEDQIKLYEQGSLTGSFDLYLPTTPQMADGELSDTQLEAVAGGGDCCCCCTPCCSCT